VRDDPSLVARIQRRDRHEVHPSTLQLDGAPPAQPVPAVLGPLHADDAPVALRWRELHDVADDSVDPGSQGLIWWTMVRWFIWACAMPGSGSAAAAGVH
jgi:hypothetical protein